MEFKKGGKHLTIKNFSLLPDNFNLALSGTSAPAETGAKLTRSKK